MKTFIKTSLTCIVAGLAYSSYAQDAPLIRYYEAEGKTYYEAYHCVPGSDLAFYSEQQGGHLLKNTTTDANGHLLLESKEGFTPAFALNVNSANNAGVSGSGKVTFITAKDFSLNDLRLIEGINHNYLSWRAAVAEPELYVFTVLKSRDGVHYNAIGVIDARDKHMSTYSFNDPEKDAAASYKIEISNRQDHLGYVSKPIALFGENNMSGGAEESSLKNALADMSIDVYPNPFNDAAQLKIVASSAGRVTVSVMDISGRLILSQVSEFTAGTNLLALNGEEHLEAGVYLLQTEIDGVIGTQKIIKQ